MFLTILLTGGSPNIYLQDSKARRPAAIAAKGFNPGLGGGGGCNSVSHQDSTLTHLLASLTTAVIKNEGLSSHFDRVPSASYQAAAGTELELGDKGI